MTFPMRTRSSALAAFVRARLELSASDLLRDASYRRLFGSILISSLGSQVTLLAVPLTGAVLLRATPTEMGWLTAIEILPFVLFSLPSGVWLDRVRKLPVVVAGELLVAAAVMSVPLAWWLGVLSMGWLYPVAFAIGAANTTAGTAAQIVLTQVVPRERLIEAHAKNALATSGAEIAGPGIAGFLIRLLGAPLALVVTATLMVGSAGILRGIDAVEVRTPRPDARCGRDLIAGLRFVASHRLLVALAIVIGAWQLSAHAALVVQVLVATRILGLSEDAIGLCYVGAGLGTVTASLVGDRISQRIGPGPCLVLGVAICSSGWAVLACVPAGPIGITMFSSALMLGAMGGVLVFINFLALRQAVTPEPMLGRMTSTMRWLILLPAVPGALLGGWLGEHYGLRSTLACAAGAGALAAIGAWASPQIRALRELPRPEP